MFARIAFGRSAPAIPARDAGLGYSKIAQGFLFLSLVGPNCVKVRRKYVGWGLAAIVIATVIVRAVWVCSVTDGGWRIFGGQAAAALPPVLGISQSQADEHPLSSAAQWMIAETGRVANDP